MFITDIAPDQRTNSPSKSHLSIQVGQLIQNPYLPSRIRKQIDNNLKSNNEKRVGQITSTRYTELQT